MGIAALNAILRRSGPQCVEADTHVSPPLLVSFPLTVGFDQPPSGRVMILKADAGGYNRQKIPRQLLAELHAPLVERVHVPDHALAEHLMLVQREEHAQRARREFAQQ